MRFKYAQREKQSCGGVCTMVALAELAGENLNSHKELMIWGNIKRGKNTKGLSVNETEPAKVVQYLTAKKRTVEVIENQDKTNLLRTAIPDLKVPHDFYKKQLSNNSIKRTLEPLADKHFKDDARIMLIVAFQEGKSMPTHSVLARKDSGKIYVMNPDEGCDIGFTSTDFWNFVGWKKLPAPMQTIGKSKAVYMFTGISLRIT